ncbi:MAG: GntR family transcriptional regulator [Microbacterium sp.]
MSTVNSLINRGGQAPIDAPGARNLPLAMQATMRLKQAILDGDFLPGAPMIEAEIAEDLGMSKTPVREALRTLSSSGLLTTDAFRTLRVNTLTGQDVRDIYEIRAALEPVAVENACHARTADQEKRLIALLQQADELASQHDHRPLLAVNRSLHRELIRTCGNEELLRILQSQEERLNLAILHKWGHVDTSVPELQQHREIVAAFLAGDASSAADLVRAHIVQHIPPRESPERAS